jgi:hypothetical protein
MRRLHSFNRRESDNRPVIAEHSLAFMISFNFSGVLNKTSDFLRWRFTSNSSAHNKIMKSCSCCFLPLLIHRFFGVN